MINIDKDYLITVDLKNTKVKSDKTIFFYNTDLNICNIFIKLICTDEDKTIPDDLIVEFAVLKPETDEFKPLDATLISKEDLLYQVDLTTDYFDIVGKYSCEIRVSGTIENESKCFTSEEFDYVVRPNITAKLNKKIKNDKNLPILEKLIKDVKEITDGINKNEIQMKRDENLVGDNKTIVGAINQLREDVNSGGKVELTDYQKKTDDNLATEEKTIVGAVNEINSKTITLEKDDTSFNGVDDTIHNELNTNDKTIIGGINEVNSQCKDIAKQTIVENNKLYLVKADGTKLDEGTTLPTSSGSVDLSNYVTKEDGKGLSTNDYTTAEKEKLAILENYNDTDIKEKINNKADKNEFYYNYKQAKAKNAVAIFLDDVTDDLYTNREKFKTRGIKITGGLRLDGVSDSGFSPSVSSDGGVSFPTTYAHIKELQDDYGIDFAYHGTKHGNNWGTTWSISEDINAFLESTSQHGIKIMGYIGPNGANLPDESKDKFLWRRNGITGNTTAKPSMFFYPENHINLDTIKTASIFESIKKSIDTLATKEGHVLALTGHVPTVINLDNFWSLIDYIISKGIDIITATEARMRYGYAIARLPEKTMIDDILDISGKGNYVLPNYFAMTESGVIKSNYCPVRWIDVSNINNANINNIENFEFGTTIVSSGSIDLMNGIPTVGTTFINRYGKNGEDFMIYRAYNDAGLFFRDVKTRQRWDKFAIVSTTVPISPTATGYIGEMAVDTNYLYVCVASNSWIRIAKDSTWE